MPSLDFSVQEWFEDGRWETLAICRSLALAHAVFAAAIAEKPGGRFKVRNRAQVVQRYPEGDW
jgi:hypothetical protein